LNYWYVARSNELLIDMDKPERSCLHFLRRLGGALEYKKFALQRMEIHHSSSGSHLHILLTLENHFMCEVERVVWSIVLHSDIYRGCSTIMRLIHGVDAADLLITPFKFERQPDDVCECIGKHDAETMKNCPAGIRLRGDDRLRGFFGIPTSSAEMTNRINDLIVGNKSLSDMLKKL
jgi:hypothetical protein